MGKQNQKYEGEQVKKDINSNEKIEINKTCKQRKNEDKSLSLLQGLLDACHCPLTKFHNQLVRSNKELNPNNNKENRATP